MANHVTLKMEAAWSSGTLVSYIIKQCHVPEDCELGKLYFSYKFMYFGVCLKGKLPIFQQPQIPTIKKCEKYN